MKKDRPDDLAESLKQMWSALLVFEAAANDHRQSSYVMCQMEAEKKRHQDRANAEAVARYEQNDCLRRLCECIVEGAKLQWGNSGSPVDDDKFYLFARNGNGIAEGYSLQELITNIPKGE